MPYIKNGERPELDKHLQPLIDYLKAQKVEDVDGKINYAVTRIMINVYPPRYFNYNRGIGVLECIKQEFYRHMVGPYEEKKTAENGDVTH